MPSAVIIFITQEDIFGKDLAKYTFSEQCEELEDLKLEDGTTKIFLNMTSKNGFQELVSLLQYMEETKSSEEWEAVRMNILEIGIERGIQQGRQQGTQQKLEELVRKKLQKGCSVAEIADILEESEDTIRKIVEN